MTSTVGGRIRAARESAGMTQGELAVACGWHEESADGQSRISNYERGKREPTLDDLVTLGRALKVDPAELAFGHPLQPDAKEKKIIDAYRAGTPQGRGFILSAADSATPDRRNKKRHAAR
jgi:transcriptional regulator with XRE-family HTH domain